MKKYLKSGLFFIFLLTFSIGKTQNRIVLDSLRAVLSVSSDNKIKTEVLLGLSNEYKNANSTTARFYAEKAFDLAGSVNYLSGEIEAMRILATIDVDQGDYMSALSKLKGAMERAKKSKDKNLIAHCFLSIGDVYSTLRSFDKAIGNYESATQLYNQLKNKEGSIVCLNKIGNRMMDKGTELNDTSYYRNAIVLYEKAKNLAFQLKDSPKLINSYINLADAYIILGNKLKSKNDLYHAIDCSLRALRLSRKALNTRAEALSFVNIAEAFEGLNQIAKAIHYYEVGLQKYRNLGDKKWWLNINKCLANAYLRLNNFNKAIEHCMAGIEIAKQENLKTQLRDYYQLLSGIYFNKKEYKNAFEAERQHANYKDSVINENTVISLARLQTELELDKKDLQIELLNKNAVTQNETFHNQIIQRNFLIGGIIIVLFLLAFIYSRYLEKNKAQEQIVKAKEIAEKAKETQEQFLANTSHEIRTPMNGIIGMTNHLKDTQLSGEQREYVSAINESANSLLVIINDLLDLSKINAGKMAFEKEPFKLTELVKNLIYSLQFRSTEKNIRLVSSIDEKIPLLLVGDAVRLNQILLNLIGNAIKFTEKGEVKIVAKLLKDDGKKIIIMFSVQDTGIGIPENNLNSIFDSFTQASAQTTRKYGGTGLGLAIAKQLIEQQGGTISVSSKVNEGSVFLFTLPFNCQEKDIKKIISTSSDAPDFNHPNLLGLSILVVDDNKINQRVAALTLQKWNAQIELADSAKQAFEMLKKRKFNLILMDITMPEVDGFEATHYIRNKMPPPLNTIPIIAMTASALVGDREKCISMGMNEYVSKPFDPEELYTKIINILPAVNHSANLPIVDLTLLKERAEGDIPYLKEIIYSYIQEMPVYLDEMNRFVNDKNTAQIKKQAHKMKSPAKLLGAFELAVQLDLIEKSVDRKEEFEKITRKIVHMNSLCLHSVEELKKEVSSMS